MNNNIENKLSMYQKVQFYLAHHAFETAAIPMVAILHEALNDQVSQILNLLTAASADITGYAAHKKAVRADLSAKILKLSTAIAAFASVNNDRLLAEKYGKTLSGLWGMRENDLYVFAEIIIQQAAPMTADLAPFGVQESDVMAADSACITYLSAINSPEERRKERSKIFEELGEMMTGTDALLRDKVDSVMAIYQATNISLYNGYLGARRIDGTGSHRDSDYSGTVAPATVALVAEIAYLAGRRFDIENTGDVDLLFALSTDPAELNGMPLAVAAASSFSRISRNLNPNEAAVYLLFQNTDLNITGSYKVRIED